MGGVSSVGFNNKAEKNKTVESVRCKCKASDCD